MCFVASAADTRMAARAAGRAEPRAARACQTKGRERDYKVRIGKLICGKRRKGTSSQDRTGLKFGQSVG